jgi:hypothetical protein
MVNVVVVNSKNNYSPLVAKGVQERGTICTFRVHPCDPCGTPLLSESGCGPSLCVMNDAGA